MKKAFITGIAGQDGSYLAEHLLDLGYEVHGIVRRNSTPEHQESRIGHLEDKVKTYYGDLIDYSTLHKLLTEIQPDEIYNIGAQSHVRISYDIPIFTAQSNAVGVLNILESYKISCPNARFYQASSSEMFGSAVDEDGFQRESTRMNPVSPYGCTKVFGYNIVRNYRNAFNLFATNGILFNHESPRRGSNFVTNKVVKGAVRIKLGLQDKLYLGNLDATRDWGHAKDYVEAMWMMLQTDNPDDYVCATGISHSVKDLCEYTFSKLGLDFRDYVIVDEKHFRPEELENLKGDSSKLTNELGWKPKYTFESMLDEMIQYWIEYYGK